MLRPSTRVRFALRAALRRRYSYAALRVLRRGLRAALLAHQAFSVCPTENTYRGDRELRELARQYRHAVRRLLLRWPSLNFTDERSTP